MVQQLRENSRRSSERRRQEKRTVEHDFGSPLWTAEVMKHYVMWPKNDQRHDERRALERRNTERRVFTATQISTKMSLAHKQSLLSNDELTMLAELATLSADEVDLLQLSSAAKKLSNSR